MILLRRSHPRLPSRRTIPHPLPRPPLRRTIPNPLPRPPSRRAMPCPHVSVVSALASHDPRTTSETFGGRPTSSASALAPHAPTHDGRNLGRPAGLPRVRPRAVGSSAPTRLPHPPSLCTIPCPPVTAAGVQPPLPRRQRRAGPSQKHRGSRF